MISSEPVRSRWTPKPEQILILEHIFNSGLVNPPKDETGRIRRLLEKFGPVGDANVFYWFQNRRSRSRRRQRQMGVGVVGAPSGGVILCEPTTTTTMTSPSSTSSSSNSSSVGGGGFLPSSSPNYSNTTTAAATGCCSSNLNLVGDANAANNDLFTISRQMGFPKEQLGETPLMIPTSRRHLHYQPLQPATESSGPITVFINGVPSEFPGGSINMRATFGDDTILVHSSGETVPLTEDGFLYHCLQMGESYFLVSKATL